jgi:hypothetical protein
MDLGLTLEEQLRDDPRYCQATDSQLDKAVKECRKQYLEPLECVDRYLMQFRREGQYRTISSGMTDPEGRWQAFIDYSNAYLRYFTNPKWRILNGIEEDEVGVLEEAAFDVIRLRTVPDMPKLHAIMRDLPKYCTTKEGKRDVLKIAEDVEPVLPRDECVDQKGNPLSPEAVEAKWAAANRQQIIYHIKKAWKSHETKREKETPLDLLDAAYRKLTHDNMDTRALAVGDYKKARQLAAEIKGRADDLESEIYHLEKEYRSLARKKT